MKIDCRKGHQHKAVNSLNDLQRACVLVYEQEKVLAHDNMSPTLRQCAESKNLIWDEAFTAFSYRYYENVDGAETRRQ